MKNYVRADVQLIDKEYYDPEFDERCKQYS